MIPVGWDDIFADLSYWYGMSFNEIVETPLAALSFYVDQLPRVQAQQKIHLAEVGAVPNLKRWDRSMLIRNWNRAAYGKTPGKTVPEAVLKLKGINVVHVRKTEV